MDLKGDTFLLSLSCDLLPRIRTELTMVRTKEKEEMDAQEQAQRSGDHRSAAAGRRRPEGRRCGARGGREHVHDLRLESEVRWHGRLRSAGGEAVADENARLKKLVADLSLDKDALQSVIRKNGLSSQQ